MSTSGQDSVWLLTFKGNQKHRHQQLGIGVADKDLSVAQQSLRKIAEKQNFDSSELGRPNWANGAFVFVSLQHAAEIEKAISESGIELQSHNVLISGRYRKLVEDLLHTPVGNNTRDQYQSSRKGAIKSACPVASKTFSHSESTAVTGPVDFLIAEVPLRMRRTFLEYDAGGSEDSRKTRTTGDRPLKVAPSSKLVADGEERLPPRDADYGLNRKKFNLRAMKKKTGVSSSSSFPAGIAQDDDMIQAPNLDKDVDDTGPTNNGEQEANAEDWLQTATDSYTVGSVETQDLEDIPEMPSADCTLVQQLMNKYCKQFEVLDQVLPDLEYLGDPSSEQLQEISSHFMDRSDVCMRIYCDLMESTSFSPAHFTASSALEAPEERRQSIKALLRQLREKAATFLATIQPCLQIHSIFGDGPYGVDEFALVIESRMGKLLKQLQGVAGSSSLAQAQVSLDGLELEALKTSSEKQMRSVFSSSLSAEHIREVLEMLSRKKNPMPWKLTASASGDSDEDEDDEELTPYERYLMRKRKAKERAIRKKIREENRQRKAPAKRGVPGAFPRRGKRNA